jgi:hypothetical protein
MVFSLFMILLVFVVVYVHYLQGFFSGTLSAIVAVVAGAVAIGYHEVLIASLLGGRYADQASALATCILFASVYIVLRLIIDTFVYGNVRLPPIVDKIGGAVTGLVAGLIAVGVVTFAAQTLPFGPSIGGYSRLPISEDRTVTVPPAAGRSVFRDAQVFGELQPDSLDAPQGGMLLPALGIPAVAGHSSRLAARTVRPAPRRRGGRAANGHEQGRGSTGRRGRVAVHPPAGGPARR